MEAAQAYRSSSLDTPGPDPADRSSALVGWLGYRWWRPEGSAG